MRHKPQVRTINTFRGGGFISSDKLIGCCRFDDVLPLIECRQRNRLPENPKTVIVCLFPYFAGDYPGRNVARYAIVNDYHTVCVDILNRLAAQLKAAFPEEEFAVFVDNSPVREVKAARLAGLGVIGNHGMIIHETYGSRVFIGEIVTTLELKPAAKADETCLNCGLCVKACPTGAIRRDKPFRRELCRSAITQKKAELTDFERGEIKSGGLVWGCDICSDVCPLNKDLPLTPIEAFLDGVLPVLTPENIGAALLNKPYNWRGKDVVARNLHIIQE